MSYPGYPFQPAPGGNPSQYPQQGAPYPPGGGYPPPPNSAPYPSPYPTPYPPSGGVFPPSLGFSAQAPVYMPQGGGYPQQPGYPQPGYPQPPQGAAAYPYPGPGASYPAPNAYGGGGADHAQQQSYGSSYAAPPRRRILKRSPTVVPADPFDPTGDAEILRKAMKGFGTDEKAIINVLARRTNEQRMEIAVQFKTLYGKDLVKDLKSEVSGNFKKLVVALMTPLPQLYARQIHDAISGLGTDEEVLIEVFCTMTNEEIQTVRVAYESDFGNCLEEDLRSDTSGTFKRLMVSLCNANRDESMETDVDAAVADAQLLLEAGENQWGTDESTFNMILCQRNYAQLQLTFEEYHTLSGHDIEDTIKSEFSGDSENAFLAIVRSIRNQPLFFAKCIHDAIDGIGTKDNKLIRITATRCEIDMGDIKDVYAAKYGESLAEAISGDTSGDYKKCLLALIGEY